MQFKQFIEWDKVYIVAMIGFYFWGDVNLVFMLEDEVKFEFVIYIYYEQFNGYQYFKMLNFGYYFYSGAYVDEILSVFNFNEKIIIYIFNVNFWESMGDKIKEVDYIIYELGDW